MLTYNVCWYVWQFFSRGTHFHFNFSWASRPETYKKSLASSLNSGQLLTAGKHRILNFRDQKLFSVMFQYHFIRYLTLVRWLKMYILKRVIILIVRSFVVFVLDRQSFIFLFLIYALWSRISTGSLNMAVLGVHCAQLCASLTMEGRVQEAQRQLKAQQDLVDQIRYDSLTSLWLHSEGWWRIKTY